MANNIQPGVIDYSDDPILPPWYIPGWTSQNEENVAAPQTQLAFTSLPANFVYCSVKANYNDGNGAQIGGYLTFEQSENLLYQDPLGTYYRLPKRLVGTVPAPTQNLLAYNFQGSGKVYLQYGQLSVALLTNDQPNGTLTILETNDAVTTYGFVQPTTWVYHVKEYIGISSLRYDITVPSSLSPGPVDINTLIVPGTIENNHDWNRGI